MRNSIYKTQNHLLTRIPLGQRYREHQEGRPHHQSHTAFGMNLDSRQNVIEIRLPAKKREECRRTFDGRVVLVHEVALNELNGQSGLADTCSRTRYVRPPRFLLQSFGSGTNHHHQQRRACTLAGTGPKCHSGETKRPRIRTSGMVDVSRRTLDMFTLEWKINKTVLGQETVREE